MSTAARSDIDDVLASSIESLRRSGATFGFLFGSRAAGTDRAGSDIDVAAFWATDPPASWEISLDDQIDLLVLNDAPFELQGIVATRGVLLFDDDPASRVHWQATTRKIYSDERPRRERARREYLDAVAHGR